MAYISLKVCIKNCLKQTPSELKSWKIVNSKLITHMGMFMSLDKAQIPKGNSKKALKSKHQIGC